MKLPLELIQPPNEYSVMPFWFWNDTLEEGEIIRQMDDFQAHGVDGFVIHPRVGLPHHQGWMSEALLAMHKLAIEEAHRRGMCVCLYDEGMYPSGSSSGQIVAENPALATRGLSKIDLADGEETTLQEDEVLVAVVKRHNGQRIAIIDRKIGAVIRGLHFIDEGPAEEMPAHGDLLNPETSAAFIRLVYDKYAERFGQYFGNTIFAIFTDEPALMGQEPPLGVWPGTTGILEHVNRILGYDFTPHLPALWYHDEPEALHYRAEYIRAVNDRLEETYYQPLSTWCEGHGIALTGHPWQPDDYGRLRLFQLPGQDLVWRAVLPDEPNSLEGSESTQGKCSSSAMIHFGRRRNANELLGTYGHELTWDEMTWLTNWCFVRGVNLLYPHAFYYSIRGERFDERPPDVGPNAAWWGRYREYSDPCRRLSWLNTDCEHVCEVAILGRSNYLPWRPAKACFQAQRDFNYIEERDLIDTAVIDEEGIHIAGMLYKALITEQTPPASVLAAIEPLTRSNRVIPFTDDASLIQHIDALVQPDVNVTPSTTGLRIRHILKSGFHCYFLFNEEKTPVTVKVDFSVKGDLHRFNPVTAELSVLPSNEPMHFTGHEMMVILIPVR